MEETTHRQKRIPRALLLLRTTKRQICNRANVSFDRQRAVDLLPRRSTSVLSSGQRVIRQATMTINEDVICNPFIYKAPPIKQRIFTTPLRVHKILTLYS